MSEPNSGLRLHAVALAALLATQGAHAVELPTPDSDWRASLDTTLRYTLGARVAERDENLAMPPAPRPPAPPIRPANGFVGNGDRNFDRGSLINNRVDIFTELDIAHRNGGLHVSVAGWYDRVYNSRNDNPGPQNLTDAVPYNGFSESTRRLHGRKLEVLEAFVFGSLNVGDDTRLSARLGQYSLTWGESTFFGNNAVAGTMAPTDVVKALSSGNPQFKDTVRKVPQVSATLSLGREWSANGYVQFRWRESRLPGAGSYFDFIDRSNYTTGGVISAPLYVEARTGSQLKPRDSGQGGVMFTWQPSDIDASFAAFATQSHTTTPTQIYLTSALGPFGPVVSSHQVFPQDIRTYGVSGTSTFGTTNLGVELSMRNNQPLASTPRAPVATLPGDNDNNPAYAVGRSAHANVTLTQQLPRNPLFQEGNLLAELAWNRRVSVTRNPGSVDPQTDRDTMAVALAIEPGYRQVLVGIDMTVPLSVRYTFGRSGVFGPGFGGENTGTVSAGVTATWRNQVKLGLVYTNYVGRVGRGLYDQSLRDRDFVQFYANTSF